jgi:TPR repeat protein
MKASAERSTTGFRATRSRTGLRTGLVLSWCLAATHAYAFDDQDCARLETVMVSVVEDIRSPEDSESARQRAFDHAGQLAIEKVVGQTIQAVRENRTEVKDADISQHYQELQKSNLDGMVRLGHVEEKISDRSGSRELSISADVAVCVPKPKAKPMESADPGKATWFDPSTGEARLWYWKSPSGDYEFFDRSGFHPRTGEKLLPVSQKTFVDWQASVARAQRQALEKAEREKRDAAAQAERDRLQKELDDRKREQQAQAEALRKERLSKAPELCDQFAANPYDLAKPREIPGAPYELLHANAGEAIELCGVASQNFPSELRYQYQLARAYQSTDPRRARPLLEKLIGERYPAAFDNYGWLFLDSRVGPVNYGVAASIFRRGAALGDPASMNSLASLMTRNYVAASSPDEPIRLYEKAASLGHREAAAALESIAEQQRQAEIRNQQNEQAARIMTQMIGGFIAGMGRQ